MEPTTIRQIAALPYRSRGGAVSILLVTSRESKRWVIPKGNPIAGLTPHAAAALEAEEEAGIRGSVCPTPLGSYRYWKRRRNGTSEMLDVDVFPLAVTQELPSWKEAGERERRWFSLAEAASAVEEADLADLIRTFGATAFSGAAPTSGTPGAVKGRPKLSRMVAWFQKLLPKK